MDTFARDTKKKNRAVTAHQREQTGLLMSISMSTAAVTNDIYERIHHLDTGLSTVSNTLATVQEETSRAASGIDDSEWRFDNMV
jgi:hypothetical protein